MQLLSSLSLSKRLFLLSGAGIVALVAVAGIDLHSFSDAGVQLSSVVLAGKMLKYQLQSDMLHDGIRGDVLSILVAGSPEERAAALEELQEHGKDLRGYVEENKRLLAQSDAGTRAQLEPILANILPALESYVEHAHTIGAQAVEQPDQARRDLPSFQKAFSGLEDPMEAFSDAILARTKETEGSASDEIVSARWRALVGGGLAVTLLLGLALAIHRSIWLPLREILESMRAVASRDFTKSVRVCSEDEIGEIARAANTAIEAIQETLSSTQETSGELARASRDLQAISAAVCDDSRRASESAESATRRSHGVNDDVQSAASGVQELDSTTSTIAGSMDRSAVVARSAVTAAGTATETVRKLAQSSQEIGGILRLINSVAEQTNLLALNATIEAASAGEAGRGFAVVANEVKALAKQTGQATEDIARRVQAIQNDSQDAARSIDSIAAIIEEMNSLTSDVANSLAAQASAISDVASRVASAANGASNIVGQVEDVSARTGSSLERIEGVTRASEQLSSLAQRLEGLIQRYRFARTA